VPRRAPAGVVPPGGEAAFLWRFQPLEARPYSVALPLELGAAPGWDGGGGGGGGGAGGASTSTVLVLEGRGYHPARETAEAGGDAAEAAG
jgi:hypothetical protein